MSDLYSSRYIQKVLERHGFSVVSQKGSHIKFRKVCEETLTVILPANRKEIPHGTFRSILRQSRLSVEAFRVRR
ncbi:type II toxin-antitoxin system HicA family toxin [Candidatus Peregrinibacteria bacterium]|nr:type II toxin-antitoxin system HicA family toxin [Candidatus Peregrinibacteria bacterium]MBI3816415.1 type II toxin-antitoxin system HicA family toxin [Candidatus Peregrinibacteria bacterium]